VGGRQGRWLLILKIEAPPPLGGDLYGRCLPDCRSFLSVDGFYTYIYVYGLPHVRSSTSVGCQAAGAAGARTTAACPGRVSGILLLVTSFSGRARVLVPSFSSSSSSLFLLWLLLLLVNKRF